MPMVSYRCACCGADDEHFYHSRDAAPKELECRAYKLEKPKRERIERRVQQPDGTVVLEYEEVELAPTMTLCTGTMLQRVSLPGELWARPARGFEPLVVFERDNWQNLPAGQERYYIPGRNWETTEPGMRRIELTNMAEYNRWVKTANEYETQKMRDHRDMHKFYWDSRRKAMRDHVDARIRHSPTLVSIARLVRKLSDAKSARRYGKPLDAHFHAQLLEFDQGKIQDWCAEDSGGRHGWQSRRAK